MGRPPKATQNSIVPVLEAVYKGKTDFLIVNIPRMLSHDNPNSIPKAYFSDIATAKNRENSKMSKYKMHGIISDHNGQVVPIACEILAKMGKMGFN